MADLSNTERNPDLSLKLLPTPIQPGMRPGMRNLMVNQSRPAGKTRSSQTLSQFVNLLVMVVLAAGSVAIVLPGFASQPGMLFVEDRCLPHFLLGLIAIAALFNIYLFTKKWAHSAQAGHEQNSLSLVDPLTQALSNALGVGHSEQHLKNHLG